MSICDPSRVCNHCYPFAYVNMPLYPAVFCKALAPVHLLGVYVPKYFSLYVPAPAPVHALRYSRYCSIGKLVQSAEFSCHMCMDSSCLLQGCSAFEHSFWVVPPTQPSFVSTVYHISLMDALLLTCMGTHGWVARICQPWDTGKKNQKISLTQELAVISGSSWMSVALNLHLAMLFLTSYLSVTLNSVVARGLDISTVY